MWVTRLENMPWTCTEMTVDTYKMMLETMACLCAQLILTLLFSAFSSERNVILCSMVIIACLDKYDHLSYHVKTT